ncbi:DUF4259 domain-containing protein [Leifsonia aquatica]|uniref:DUF4259 domain-containing protein n=1 Tax=Leifsonia aquatica TaxID=144185 RepID=UPI00381FBEC8
MGAWGSGPFENDGAGDLLAEIGDGSFSFDEIVWAFEDDDYLEVDGGQMAIALAELVIVVREQKPVAYEGIDLAAFQGMLNPERIQWIHDQAVRATSDSDASELYELWEDAGDLDNWLLPARATIAKLL